MALSMDEQRILAEIERRLADEDPGLAASLSEFKRPVPFATMRSPRARVIGSVLAVVAALVLSLMVYAMIPFKAQAPTGVITPQATGGVSASAPARPGQPAGKPAVPSRPAANSSTPSGSRALATETATTETANTGAGRR
jgi:hypothetical protein